MKRLAGFLLVIAALVLIVIVGAWNRGSDAQGDQYGRDLFEVRRGELKITLTENGSLSARNNVRIESLANRPMKIAWLIEEGAQVNEGDLLVQFETEELENKLRTAQGTYDFYVADLEVNKSQMEVQLAENTQKIADAKMKLSVAEMELEQYEKGDALIERRQLELAKEQAESVLAIERERYENMQKLEKQGFVTKTEVEEQRLKFEKSSVEVETATMKLQQLETYGHPTKLLQRQNALESARIELEKAQKTAESKVRDWQARIDERISKKIAQEEELALLKADLTCAEIRAPKPGIVIYGDPKRSETAENVKVGAQMNRNIPILTIPDLTEFLALVKIHEVDIEKVRIGQPALVTIESYRNKTLNGKVTKVAPIADTQSWRRMSDVKEFSVEIAIEGKEHNFKPGISVKTEIIVETLPDAVYVPIQAVFVKSGKNVCFVGNASDFESRSVEIGLSNDRYVQIVSGLEAGDTVLLWDPQYEQGDTDGGHEQTAEPSDPQPGQAQNDSSQKGGKPRENKGSGR